MGGSLISILLWFDFAPISCVWDYVTLGYKCPGRCDQSESAGELAIARELLPVTCADGVPSFAAQSVNLVRLRKLRLGMFSVQKEAGRFCAGRSFPPVLEDNRTHIRSPINSGSIMFLVYR